LMKVSKISSLEETHRININIRKLCHGNIHLTNVSCFIGCMTALKCVMSTNERSMILSVPCSLL
jgi:hypothetical protein